MTNTTDEPVTGRVAITGAAGVDMSLLPHHSRVLPLPVGEESGRLGGITVRHAGPPGAVLARGWIFDAAGGYSANLRFTDPATAKSSSYHGAGVRLADVAGMPVAPAIVAYNAGTDATTITGRLRVTVPDESPMAYELTPVQLGPGETQAIDLFDDWAHARGLTTAPAGVEFEYSTPPGSVIMAATSVSANAAHSIRVPLTDPASLPSATGGYPWRITASSATTVYLKNTTTTPQEYVLQLTQAGEAYSLGLRTIEAGETVTVDIKTLRDTQAPDERGPPSARGRQCRPGALVHSRPRETGDHRAGGGPRCPARAQQLVCVRQLLPG